MKLKYKDIPKIKKQLRIHQKDKCAICLRSFKRMSSKEICLDHDHKTGYIRAVLCRGCNSMEGKVYRTFVRMGLEKRKVNYFNFLVNLANYYMEYVLLKIKGTDYIHPKFKEKK